MRFYDADLSGELIVVVKRPHETAEFAHECCARPGWSISREDWFGIGNGQYTQPDSDWLYPGPKCCVCNRIMKATRQGASPLEQHFI